MWYSVRIQDGDSFEVHRYNTSISWRDRFDYIITLQVLAWAAYRHRNRFHPWLDLQLEEARSVLHWELPDA